MKALNLPQVHSNGRIVTFEIDREEDPSPAISISALIDRDDRWCRLQSSGP
jgi:hypothetical protein